MPQDLASHLTIQGDACLVVSPLPFCGYRFGPRRSLKHLWQQISQDVIGGHLLGCDVGEQLAQNHPWPGRIHRGGWASGTGGLRRT